VGAVLRAFCRLSQAIELQTNLLKTEPLPQRMGQQNHLSIDFRTGKAQGFRPNLMKLAIPAALRALVPKHRTHVIQALATVVEQVVFDHGTHHAGRGLRAQRQGFAVEAILERIHFFFDDIGHLAQATHEKRCGLDNRRAHILIGKAGHQFTHLRLQPFPARRFRRQQIVHAFDGGDFFAHR